MKKSVNDIITERILAALDQGIIPWRKPWVGSESQNLFHRKPYSGINRLMTAMSPHGSSYWATANQMKKAEIRWSGPGTPIVFWTWVRNEDKETGEVREYAFLRYFMVWNLEQMTLPEGFALPEEETLEPFDPVEEAEKIMGRFPVRHTNGDRAAYNYREDLITLPGRDQFPSAERYYGTAFHEAAHATGHESRLNRNIKNRFGSSDYALEELVAEIGSAFTLGRLGMLGEELENSAAYCQHWAGVLGKNPAYIVKAAGQAEKALAWMTGEHEGSSAAEEPEALAV